MQAWAQTAASVTAAPTPIVGLEYTGSAQTLINAGTASGGTMNYSLDGSAWSTTLPTGTDWGTYTVYYKAVGDAYHTDSESGTITAIIGKANSNGLTIGPWTFDAVITGWTGYEGAGTYSSFNGLNDTKWLGNTYRYNDADGCGYAYIGTTTVNSKYAVYSTYKHTETVPAYTRKVLTWSYQLAGWTSSRPQTTALYAADNLAYLKTVAVDFTEGYTDATHGSGNAYHLAHLVQQSQWGAETSVLTAGFAFDNRAGSTSQDKTSGLLLTQVIGDATGASNFVHTWGGFKDVESSWTTYYYKHITYDANGGDGSMAVQEIENSGTLNANAFTRTGYTFTGWSTSPDGAVAYPDEASITATESDKGLVTLYAQWISQGGKVIGANGGLCGVFSVSETTKIQFSQGNLQAVFASAGTSCTWQFAANQYDYVGNAAANNAINGNGSVSAAGTVDLFGWSTVSTYYGINNSGDAADYSGDFVDWGNLAISNGGNTANSGWRTLTRDEWAYLFNKHTYGYATVAGVKGIIIVPDDYSGPAINSNHDNTTNPYAYNIIDASSWASTYVPAGVVFLPAAGFRIPWFGQVQENAYYWTSTPVNDTQKYATLVGKPGNGDIITYSSGGNWPANDGFSVRLVKNVFTLLPGTQAEGPWTFNAAKSQLVNSFDINSISYNSLNGSGQGAISQLSNSNGLGFTANGACPYNSKQAIFSFYSCSQSVPSYSRMRLTWNYEIHSHYDAKAQQAALYAHTDESELKDQALDFTVDNSTDAGSAYCIGLIHHAYPNQNYSQSYSHDFYFDNSNESSQETKTWYLILTQIINDGSSPGQYNGQWATFKSTGTSIAYDYYKYITYDANGGTGSMSVQQIENTGTLTSNAFTRAGFTFAGWATSPDGDVVYADEASITATESDKGQVTLYAQWTSATYLVTANADPEHTGIYYSTFYYGSANYQLPASGVEAFVATVSGEALNLTRIAGGYGVIPQGTAVILKSTTQNYILAQSDDAPVLEEDNDLEGVDAETAISAVVEGTCYVLSGVNGVGFYKYEAPNQLQAHKAYIDLPAGTPAPRRMRFVFDEEQTVTGIDGVEQPCMDVQKRIENGQLIIIRGGEKFNAQGQMVK